MALATTELIAALAAPHRPGPVASVASRVVDVGAGSLKDLAVDLFGTNDKAALVVGIVIVSLALGAVVGVLAARWWWVALVAFGGAGVVGVIASARDPQASVLAGTLACVAGAVLGATTLLVLLRLVPVPASAPVTAPASAPAPCPTRV